MAPPPRNRIVRRLFRAPVWLYRWNCGWLLGHRFLLLIHTGRRTRRQRYTVLEVMEFRKASAEAIVMCAWGRNADWLRNIQAMPNPGIVIGSSRFTAAWRVLDVEDFVHAIGCPSPRPPCPAAWAFTACTTSSQVRPSSRRRRTTSGSHSEACAITRAR
jgi:deazaflavin-dependent oxidoreductase (nitroreductase family)